MKVYDDKHKDEWRVTNSYDKNSYKQTVGKIHKTKNTEKEIQ